MKVKTLLRFYKSMAIGFVFTAFVLALVNICPAQSISSTEIDDIETIEINPIGFETTSDTLSFRGDGVVVGTNKITITIADETNAGSNADYINLFFGRAKQFKLRGWPCEWEYWENNEGSGFYTPIDWEFPRGATMSWNIDVGGFDQDNWDYLCLRTSSTDGIKIDYVKVLHSSEKICEWSDVNRWLDKPDHCFLGLGAKIMKTKLKRLGNPLNQIVFFGALELGKTDGTKYYGTTSNWCSDFASWCIRKAAWKTPTGDPDVNVDEMISYFAARDRLYDLQDVLNGVYLPKPGDYIAVSNGNHSVIFAHWYKEGTPKGDDIYDNDSRITDPDTDFWPTPMTRFKTIEGNCNKAVRTRTRTVSEIYKVGKTQ